MDINYTNQPTHPRLSYKKAGYKRASYKMAGYKIAGLQKGLVTKGLGNPTVCVAFARKYTHPFILYSI